MYNKLNKLVAITFITALVAVFSTATYAQGATDNNNDANNTNTDDKGQQNQSRLEFFPLNDFESAEDWRAFSTSPLGSTKIKKVIQRGPIQDVFNPGNLSEEEKAKFTPGDNHVLGIKGYIKDRGFDRIEVKPPHEYVVKGLGRQLSVWALGRNFRHTLYVKMRDYRGRIHKLRLGRLDYLGWRKLTVTIPGWLPQSTRYSMLDKNLHFVSLFIQSDNHEVAGQFYFYVDELSMLVDKTEMKYPGSLIKDTW